MGIVDSLQISQNPEWETPSHVFRVLDEEFRFTLDVCADGSNHKCERYFTKEDDGLAQDWSGETCWMNPPYGRPIPAWVKKAADSCEDGRTVVVGLLPNRTDTRWWADHVMRASEIRLVKGRIAFGGAGQCAPFGSVVVVWGTPRPPLMSLISFQGEEETPRRPSSRPPSPRGAAPLESFCSMPPDCQ